MRMVAVNRSALRNDLINNDVDGDNGHECLEWEQIYLFASLYQSENSDEGDGDGDNNGNGEW